MWEEQSHRECSPEKDAYGLDKYKCNLATLNRPGQPDQPTTTGGPRTVTITTRQAATLIASGSGITRQPPGPKVIISKAFIVYTNPAVRYQTTTILGTSIEVEFTPASYTWGWGDGTTTTTTDPGAPYPHQTVTHHYQHTATGVTTTLTTTWTTRFRPTGDSQWRPIEGTITTTETSTPYDLVRIITYLTDHDVDYTTWAGWHRLDNAERELGAPEGRERKKIVEWEDMVVHARHQSHD